jgi:HAD superfamily hydrolase (TIGR01509 family)
LKPIKAISFDMDGTLYRVSRLRVAWRLRWERGLLLALLAAREKIRHEPPFPDRDALYEREAELVAPSFNLSVEQVKPRLASLRAAMPDALTMGMRPYPGVVAALEAAHAKKIRLAVLSDYDPIPKLAHLGLSHLPWAATVSADEFGALKPHPRSFLEVAQQLGCAPDEMVHVGDREDLDVQGALASGMRAWRIASKRTVNSRSERVFSRYTVDLFARLAD